MTPNQKELSGKLTNLHRVLSMNYVSAAGLDEFIRDALGVVSHLKAMQKAALEASRQFTVGDLIYVYGIDHVIPDGSACTVSGYVVGDEDDQSPLMIADYMGASYFVSKEKSVKVKR